LATVKSQILNQLSNNYPSFLKKDLLKFIDIILKEMSLSLKKNERVEIRGAFIFDPRIQKPRTSFNPITRQKINIPQKKTINFKISKEWFKVINEKE
tara:strand:- start:7133 stop:7423 length:291 start_codon:yes stop_codon:yes gene_type:complete